MTSMLYVDVETSLIWQTLPPLKSNMTNGNLTKWGAHRDTCIAAPQAADGSVHRQVFYHRKRVSGGLLLRQTW